MKQEILAIKPIFAPSQKVMDEEYVVHKLWQADDAGKLVADIAPRVRALVTIGTTGASRDLIERLPALELIASSGAGTSQIALDFAKHRGVAVTNTPDAEALAESVADLTLGMMLALGRRICESDSFVRAGKWPRGEFPLTRSFGGKRLGILGLGSVGKCIARRAKSFDMNVAYSGPRAKPEFAYRYYPDLQEMARNVDFLVVACPARPETRHLVDSEVLEALGADGILVNIARGSIVDTAALVGALRRKAIRGAALDVFDDEPNIAPHLLAAENVLLTPHIGSSTYEIRSARGETVLANLRAHFAGGALQSRVV